MLRSGFAGFQLEHGDAAVAAADEAVERSSENRLRRSRGETENGTSNSASPDSSACCQRCLSAQREIRVA